LHVAYRKGDEYGALVMRPVVRSDWLIAYRKMVYRKMAYRNSVTK
jgi:hypothetical protein